MVLTQEDLSAINQLFDGRFRALEEDVSCLKEDVAGLKKDVSGLKKDVARLTKKTDKLEEDVSGLKKDVSELKEDVAGLKEDVAGLKEDVAGLKEDVSRLKEDVSCLKEDVSGLKQWCGRLEKKTDDMMEMLTYTRDLALDIWGELKETRGEVGLKPRIYRVEESGTEYSSGPKDDEENLIMKNPLKYSKNSPI